MGLIGDPILSCLESLDFERALFSEDTEAAAQAMERAGNALAVALLCEWRRFLTDFPVLLLIAGKGNNTGDALVAALALLRHSPNMRVDLLPLMGTAQFSPAVIPWFEQLREHPRCRILPQQNWRDCLPGSYDLALDGVFGMQFRLPLPSFLEEAFGHLNAWPIRLRVAVDLPSGIGDASAEIPLRADVTYATGIVKQALMLPEHRHWVGRLRYLDIGLFHRETMPECVSRVFARSQPQPLREHCTDKRSYGHLLIVAGHRRMPGAMQMAVMAAIRSGVGLVTVIAPESVVPAVSACVPEAMWHPWPETAEGGLAWEGMHDLHRYRGKVTALLMGPGLGQEAETHALLDSLLEILDVPLVLDADALTSSRMQHLQQRVSLSVLTPHAGEFRRIAPTVGTDTPDDAWLRAWCAQFGNLALVLKGPLSRVVDRQQCITIAAGGPVLARGGSGDLLAGLLAGAIANPSLGDPFRTVVEAVHHHSLAADRLASLCGEQYVRTTQLLEHLEPSYP